MNKGLNLFEKENFKSFSELKFSRLYSLEPIGLGTSRVESLTSYITRLAKAHSVTTATLIAQEISPLLDKKHLNPERSRKVQSGSMREVIKSIDSTGQTANEWSKQVEKLTLRSDINLLTMLPFQDLFSTRNLLHKFRVWCPLCYESAKEHQEVIYEQLLWRIKAASFCTIHHFPLQSSCNNCAKNNLPILASSSQPGYCHYCKQWLGYSEAIVSDQGECNRFEIFISEYVSEILFAGTYLTTTIIKHKITNSLKKCIEYFCGGRISAFARLTKVSSRIITNWLKGTNLFRLDLLAQICWKINIPLKNFFEWNLGMTLEAGKNFNRPAKKHQYKKKINLAEMKKAMENAICQHSIILSVKQIAKDLEYDQGCFRRHFPELYNQLKEQYNNSKKRECDEMLVKMEAALNEFPPPSVATLSRRLNRCVPTLYRLFPQICFRITRNHKDYKKKANDSQRSIVIKEIKNIASLLHEDGIYPSQKNVSQLMTNPGQMGNKFVRDTLKEVQQELKIT